MPVFSIMEMALMKNSNEGIWTGLKNFLRPFAGCINDTWLNMLLYSN